MFDTLRENLGEQAFGHLLAERVHCVTGEVTKAYFGLSRGKFNALAAQLDVVVNSAASVNFREELDRALQINTLSLDNLVKLCEVANNIPLVHVSTCYVNGYRRGNIDETTQAPIGVDLPPSPAEFRETAALIERLQLAVEALRQKYEGRALKVRLIELGRGRRTISGVE